MWRKASTDALQDKDPNDTMADRPVFHNPLMIIDSYRWFGEGRYPTLVKSAAERMRNANGTSLRRGHNRQRIRWSSRRCWKLYRRPSSGRPSIATCSCASACACGLAPTRASCDWGGIQTSRPRARERPAQTARQLFDELKPQSLCINTMHIAGPGNFYKPILVPVCCNDDLLTKAFPGNYYLDILDVRQIRIHR